MHKNDYSVIVFFGDVAPKKWKFVHKLKGFVSFLNNKYQGWTYINVYERRTGKFLKRFSKDSVVPDFITHSMTG